MKYHLITTAAALIVSLAPLAPAYASRGADGTNRSMIRQEIEAISPQIKLVRIEGALSCDMGAENNGKACDLKLRESKTGHTFNLIEAKAAMQLYQGGNKNVAIEGRLEDTDTLEVRDAQIL